MKKKNLIIAVAAIAALGTVTGQTIAYFTSSSTQTNTFTVGDLDIEETEPAWDDPTDGKDMYPGLTLYKDPTVKNVSKGKSGEEPGYFRMYIEVKDSSGRRITDTARLNLIRQTIRFDSTYDPVQMTSSILKEGKTPGYSTKDLEDIPMYNKASFEEDAAHSSDGIYCFNYKDPFTIGEQAILFTNVVIPTDWGKKELSTLGEYTLEVRVEAIQSKGFASRAEAFAALDKELKTV